MVVSHFLFIKLIFQVSMLKVNPQNCNRQYFQEKRNFCETLYPRPGAFHRHENVLHVQKNLCKIDKTKDLNDKRYLNEG